MKISRKIILRAAIALILLLMLALIALAGLWWYQTPHRFPSTARLMTDRPEFAAYAELFNAEQNDYRINVIYREEPATAGTAGLSNIDLVVAPFLNNPDLITTYRPLTKLFPEEEAVNEQLLEPRRFYQQFLDLGRDREGLQRLLPVSFNLPTLTFLEGDREVDEESFSLNLESIQEESGSYNLETDGRYSRMGFSPRWNPEVLYVKTNLFETSFRAKRSGAGASAPVEWDEGSLERTVTFIRNWIETVNQGRGREQDFIDIFMYDPPLKLLAEKRILFTYMTLSDFFQIAPERRRNLDFQWIAREDVIPVEDDALFIGIPNSAQARPAAEAFLLWFFSPETQIAIIEANQFKRMRTFGIADGLSSLPAVNENYLPRFFPSLVGHIPPEDYLRFPLPLPRQWNQIKEELIIPWLLEKASVEEPESIPPLQERIDLWYRQQSSE